MAESLLKLKVDSQEYDQKIKRAAEGIQQYAQKCREAGGTLEHLDDGVLEFVQALGKMDTVATTTKQQMREMSNALTTLTQTYRGLTDEEKASPFGQELARGIDQLTERAGQAQDAMSDVQASIRNAASDTRVFDQLSQGASVMTAGFQGLTGVAKMLGIEMGDNVEVIARLQAAMAVTNSLTTIQNALQKQSALMQGVQAVQATAAATAQALYAKNTALATAAGTAFNAVAKANPYVLLASAVVAVGVALVGFSKNAKKAAEATEAQTDAMKQAQRMADIWKNTIGSTFSSLMTKYDELKRQWQSLASEHSKTEWIKKNQTALQNLGGAVNDIKTAEDFFNNNTDAVVQSFVRRAQAAARVAQLTELYRKQIELLDKKSQASADITADAARQGRSAKGGDIIKDATYRSSKYGKVNAQGQWVFTDAGAKLYSGTDTSSSSTVMKIDVELQANQANIDKIKNQITDEFKDVSILSGGGSGKGGAGGGGNNDVNLIAGSIGAYEQRIAELKKDQKDVTSTKEWDDLQSKIGELVIKVKELKGELKVEPYDFGADAKKRSDDYYKETENKLSNPDKIIGTGLEKIVKQISLSQTKKEVNLTQEVGNIASGLNSIMGGIENLGIEIPEGMKDVMNGLQGLISIVSGIATICAAIQTIQTAQMFKFWSGGGVVHAATGLIVPGSSYSGDMVPSMINSGELILNRAQQGVIAGELEGGAGRSVHVTGMLRGEDIVLVADRWGRRTGKGELAFWK